MPIHPSNPFAAIIHSIFPELAGAGGMVPHSGLDGGFNAPLQDGPAPGVFQDRWQDFAEQPGAPRGEPMGLPGGLPMSRGGRLIPHDQMYSPGTGLFDMGKTYGEDRNPGDFGAVHTPADIWKFRSGGPTTDPNNPFSWEPTGFRMNAPGVGSVNSGKGFGYPTPGNDNAGGGKSPRGPAGNDNGAAPIPFPASYSPQQQALQEQGLDPNGVQAQAYAQLPGGQKDSPVTVQPKKAGIVSQGTVTPNARDTFVRAVVGAESGGNPNAKNPHSSAEGLGQFITGTWDQMMRKHPELGLTRDGRRNAAQSLRALNALADDNEAYLAKKGIPISPGSLYAAHFLGAQGAVQVLRNSDDKPMASVVGPGVVKANPFLAQMTVGEFRQWAERKMAAHGNTALPPTGSSEVPPLTTPPADNSGPGNFTAGMTPDQQNGAGGRGSNGNAEVQSDQSSSGPPAQEDVSTFQPYLQELAQRRAAYRQRRADRRSHLEELLSLGDQRGK